MKSYYRLLCSNEGERDDLRINLTLKGTHFFRGNVWEYFAENCASAFAQKTNIRIWCAGCSSGEEAYSMIMVLLDFVKPEVIDVLATDYNDELLEKCNKAEYFNMHFEEIPEKYRHHVITGAKKFSIKPYLRECVHTANVNLLFDEYPAPFDIIVCRNVIKFFAADVIPRVQRGLINSLSEGGFLLLSVDGNNNTLELVQHPTEMGVLQLDDMPIYVKQ